MPAPEPRYRIYTRPSDYALIARELARGWSGDEQELGRLEEAVEGMLGVRHAICAPQNRVGVYLAVRALVRPGRKILLSPYTLSDVINMVLCAGAVPVFCDVKRETCNLDPAAVRDALAEHDDVDAVMTTHLHGYIDDMSELQALCEARGLALLEDSAQAFGARRDGTFSGAFGNAGIFSFGMYKNVNAFFGGMIVTNRDDVAARIRSEVRGFPRQSARRYLRKVGKGLATDIATYPPVFKGFTFHVFRYAFLNDVAFLNRQVTIEQEVVRKERVPDHYLVRMSPVQAHIIRRSLSDVPAHNRHRVEAARIYEHGLRDIEALTLPPFFEDGRHIYTYYPLQAPDRDGLIRHMVREGRDVAVQHLRNCNEVEAFADIEGDTPSAAAAASQVILLSTYPRFPLSEVEANVAAIRQFYGR